MKPTKLLQSGVRFSFWAGALFMAAWFGLLQDLAGKERYLYYADKYWLDGRYTLPIEIFLVVLTTAGYLYLRSRAKAIDAKVTAAKFSHLTKSSAE